MRIVAVFVSDRGDLYLPDCLRSFHAHVDQGVVAASTVVNDSDHHWGMAGAVRAGFEWVLADGADYVLWVEEDMRFDAPVPVAEMVTVLERIPRLAQVVLKRHPWSQVEIAAGGQIEVAPDEYTDRSFGLDCRFVEHRRLFSLNPMIAPRRVLELGWPDGNEAGFTERCLEAGYSFAYYGARADPPLVTHVGSVRGAGWRL